MSKLVYLDSSDFSNLSCPKEKLGLQNSEILSLLRAQKRNGDARFFMSAVHFSEAVHAATEHKEAALRRAELMQELCEQNVLRFPTELPKFELRKALIGKDATLSHDELLSEQGQWFGFHCSMDSLRDARRNANSEIDRLLAPLPRHQRRKLRSSLDLKKKSSHAKWREIIASGTAPTAAEFPFNILSPDAAVAWFLGEISDNDYRQRMLTVMHDPYAMFKHLLDETKNRQKLYEIIRKQGYDMSVDLQRSTEAMRPALAAVASSEVEIDLTELINELCSRPDFLRQNISAYADISCDHINDDALFGITTSCPSLFAYMETSKSYLLASAFSCISRIRAGSKPNKKANPSDFGDLMHSFYAPYFDVFRCDVRFGALLKRHKPLRERIADRITDLPKMLSVDRDSHHLVRTSAA